MLYVLKKAIFLDRDGVINEHRNDYVKTPEEFQLISGVENWLKILSDLDFLLIIITNQSMIGRGISTLDNLNKIHSKMQNTFQSNGFKIDKIYFCPHTPEFDCDCRKPKTGLLKKAIQNFNIDVKNSWLIGDNYSDINAAKKINCKFIKISTNSSLENAVNEIKSNLDSIIS